MARLAIVLASALVLATPCGARAIDITACHSSIDDGDVGVLQTDLDCSTSRVVYVGDQGTFDFNGFTVTYDPPPPGFAWREAIWCDGKCTVTSTGAPGRLIGSGIEESTGVVVDGTRARIENVEISAFENGVGPRYPLTKAIRSRVRLVDVTLSEMSGDASEVKVVRGERIQVADCHNGLSARGRIKVKDLGCAGGANRCVTATKKVHLERADVTGSAIGVYARAMKLVESSLSGNGVDLRSNKRPRLAGTTCETSEDHESPPGTWGVCALD